MPNRNGIDVSRFQHPPYQITPINWEAVKAAGITWVAYQALKGESPDPSFTFNRTETQRLGFKYRLAYGYPTTPAAPNQPTGMPWDAQADLFMHTVGSLLPGEGVMCDAEVEGITEALTLEWLQAVEARTHKPCAVYTGGYVAGGSLWHSGKIFNGERARVFAAYSSEEEARNKHSGGIPWDAWQYTGTGSCPGVLGNCDLDQVDNPKAFGVVCSLDENVEEDDFSLVYPISRR
jgi:GH25 family lysozyme M1 (1,4-beta-N-acetylmuramidase)